MKPSIHSIVSEIQESQSFPGLTWNMHQFPFVVIQSILHGHLVLIPKVSSNASISSSHILNRIFRVSITYFTFDMQNNILHRIYLQYNITMLSSIRGLLSCRCAPNRFPFSCYILFHIGISQIRWLTEPHS